MKVDKTAVMEILYRDAQELYEKAEQRLCLMAAFLNEEGDAVKLTFRSQGFCRERETVNRLRAVIKESIEVLEESKKAFKSNQLEKLRKKLMEALIETQ